MNRLATLAALAALALTCGGGRAADDDESNPSKAALKELNDYIGTWKAAGGPDKTSKPENWKEAINFGWKFKGDDSWIAFEVKDGKYLERGDIKYLADKKKYQLALKTKAAKEPSVWEGELKKGYLTFKRQDAAGDTQLLVLNTAGEGARLIYEFKVQPKGRTIAARQYQVAATKEGVEFASGGSKKPECAVTGGLGTMAVSYNGKTYYVCCSGCRDAFNEDPEKFVKAFEARKK